MLFYFFLMPICLDIEKAKNTRAQMHEKQQSPQELIDWICFPSLMIMKGLISLSGQTI